MSSSFNIIHPLATLLYGSGDNLYQYKEYTNKLGVGKDWLRIDSKLHRIYFDKNNHLNNTDISNYDINDYVLSYNNLTNYIRYSEQFTSQFGNWDAWVSSPLINIDSKYTVSIPNVQTPASRFSTKFINSNNKKDSYISQKVLSVGGEILKLSTYICVPKLAVQNPCISLSICDSTNGYFAKTNFNLSNTVVELDIVPEIRKLNNYSFVSNALNSKAIGHIKKLPESWESEEFDYYRITIVYNSENNQYVDCRLNLLTKDGEYIFNNTDTRYYYISGFQLEKYAYNSANSIADELRNVLKYPSPYIYNTTNTEITQTIFNGVYVVQNDDNGSKILSPISSKVFFVLSADETYNEDVDEYVLENISPTIRKANVNDLLIISNILTVKNKDGIKMPIKFGMYCDTINDPLYSIYYDVNIKAYKIKIANAITEGDEQTDAKYEVLVPRDLPSTTGDEIKSMTSQNKKIVEALTFNQGYFETWSSKGKCSYKRGYNTGGGHNFWKR